MFTCTECNELAINNSVSYNAVQWGAQVEDRGHRERGSGGGSPLVRGSAQFANE
jgi:hypothetical protein